MGYGICWDVLVFAPKRHGLGQERGGVKSKAGGQRIDKEKKRKSSCQLETYADQL